MKNEEIYNTYTAFLTEYQEYFLNNKIIKESVLKVNVTSEVINNKIIKEPKLKAINKKEIKECIKPLKKSTLIEPKTDIKNKKNENNLSNSLSNYQELSKKMTLQKSSTTNNMFENEPNLWVNYHDARDFSFQGYDNQEEIPINKIIKYLESKSKHKLKILDLGCGRNIISQHFKENKKMLIIGYDYISYNGSIKCDISNLPDEDDSIKICIYSQSLMGFNWKEYLNEGNRVLEYNGEIIISESRERYEIIKSYLEKLNMKIIIDEYNETNRWFIIHAIKQ
jgi:hypothetical protein